MNAFRVLALAYALAALLIAPAWLVADEAPLPAPDPAGQPAPEAAPAPQPEAAPVAEPPPAAADAAGEAKQEPEPPAPARGEILVEDEQEAEDAAGEAKQEPVASVAASASVTIKDFEFAPASVTVNVGDTVTWANDGPTAHSATAEDGSFDTGIMQKGKSGSATFSTAGTISYVCTPHPFMKGTVVVEGDSASSDDSDSGGDSGSDSAGGDDGGSAGTTTDSSDSGSGLPATGGETALIALLGLLTLGSGLLLRRRAEG